MGTLHPGNLGGKVSKTSLSLSLPVTAGAAETGGGGTLSWAVEALGVVGDALSLVAADGQDPLGSESVAAGPGALAAPLGDIRESG